MAPRVSKHDFQWDLKDLDEDSGLQTKTFSMRVFHLDVTCFAAIYSLDDRPKQEFSYELSWAECETKPLLYSCEIDFQFKGDDDEDKDNEELVSYSGKLGTKGRQVDSSAVFPKGKTFLAAVFEASFDFNFEFSLQDGVNYNCNGMSMTEIALPLFKENVLNDLVVVCGEKTFDCHKFVLAGRSQVFKAMLTGPFKEAGENKIVIRDCDPEVAKVFLEFLYSDYVPEDAVSWELFDLAKMYDLPKLQDLCLTDLRENINVDNCSKMLEAACKHDLDDLFDDAMVCFKLCKDSVAKTEGWRAIAQNPEVLAKIALHSFPF